MSIYLELYVDVDTGGKKLARVVLFTASHTNSIYPLVQEAGLRCIWYPEEFGIENAGDLIPALKKGIYQLRRYPARFRKLAPEWGMGNYDTFRIWLKNLFSACKQHPKAKYYVEN